MAAVDDFDGRTLAALRANLHEASKEHARLRDELERSLREHEGSLRDYAQRSIALRDRIRQAKRSLSALDIDSRTAALQERQQRLESMRLVPERAEELAAASFQVEWLKHLLSSAEPMVDHSAFNGRIVAVDGRLKGLLEVCDTPSLIAPIMDAYMQCCRVDAILDVILLHNAAEICQLKYGRSGTTMAAAHHAFSLVIDGIVHECDEMEAEEGGAVGLDGRGSQRLLQRIRSLIDRHLEMPTWNLLDNHALKTRCLSLLWLKLATTLWNVAFGFEFIAGEAVDGLGACLVALHDCPCVQLLKGDASVEEMLSRLQTLHSTLPMSLMQIMNAYRRERLGALSPSELLSLLGALFAASSLREACRQEIQQDLIDSAEAYPDEDGDRDAHDDGETDYEDSQSRPQSDREDHHRH